jgi:hypothetical protein
MCTLAASSGADDITLSNREDICSKFEIKIFSLFCDGNEKMRKDFDLLLVDPGLFLNDLLLEGC